MTPNKRILSAEEPADDEVRESDLTTRKVVTAIEELCEMYEAVCDDYPITKQEDALKKRLMSAAKKQGVKKEALTRTLVEQGLNAIEKKENEESDSLDI